MTEYKRDITPGTSITKPITPDTATALHNWLTRQASEHKLTWLLLHANEGVVWGDMRGDTLHLSTNTPFQWNSLQQARLFSEVGELFVWCGPNGWLARLIIDGSGDTTEWIDEPQMLWGERRDTKSTPNAGFTPLVEGAQGIAHAPPIGDTTPTNASRAALCVRHYLDEDDAGVLRVVRSRVVKLVGLGKEKEECG